MWIQVDVDLEDLARTLGRMSIDDIVEFVSEVDNYVCDWDLVKALKAWCERELKMLPEDETR